MIRRGWLALGIAILLTPLGMLASGEAWGEWDISDWSVPGWWKSTAEAIAGLWHPILPDYSIPGWESGLLPYLGYIISGFVGVVIIYLLMRGIGKLIVGR